MNLQNAGNELIQYEMVRWAEEFRKQATIRLNRYRSVDATNNHRGPINAAFTVLGSEALAYLVEAQKVMGTFLESIADLIIECYDNLTV